MPTENRSSNTEMVSVPRARLEYALHLAEQGLAGPESPVRAAISTLRSILTEQQHQGEPVALPARLPMRSPEDRNLPKGHAPGWNACLDEIAKLGPLYTHADPAEVERLRGWVSAYEESRERLHEWLREEELTNISLRAQLAELWRATNLLMKVTPRNKGSWADKLEAKAIIERLSASAEPSAPAEIDEQPEFVKTITAKLQRFLVCAEDGQGADIGREWFDVLTKLGLLRRVQRSPAWWEMTEQGDALLARAALEHKP